MMEDITKTGPTGLKGLKGINQASKEERKQAFRQRMLGSTQDIMTQATPSPTAYVGERLASLGYGESKYDEGITSLSQAQNLSEVRAVEQPWYEQIGAGLAKGVVLAGTTFLDGTVGTVVGAANAINEGKFSAFWDNPFARAMKEVNEWSEQALPNYYTQEEQMNDANGEWYKNVFTANWWGDKFIKNLGFTAGAFATGNVVSSALGKAPGIIKSVVGSTVSAINEGKVEALNNSDEWYKFEKQKIDDKFRVQYEALQQYSNEPEIYNGLLEATNSQYETALAKLNEDKAKVGNVDLALNLPILMASNMYMWGKLYAGGSKTAISNMNIAKRNGKYISLSTPFKAFTGFLSEGAEEISQKAAATIPGLKYGSELEEFYMSRWDPEANTEVLDWTKSFAKGIADTVGDPSSWEEFTIGALTGALGMPSFRSTRTEEGKRQSPITIRGGIIGDYREYREQKDRENSMVNMLNERVSSPEFQNYYEGMIRHAKYQNDMNESAETGDDYSYKNAEDSQLISDIIMFDKAGRLNDLIEMINDASELSDENIQSIIDNTTDANGNGPFSQNGNALPKEEIKEKIQKRKDNIINQINTYRKLKDAINIEVGDKISDEQLEELIWLSAKSGRNAERIAEMAKEISPVIKAIAAKYEQEYPDDTMTVSNLRSLADGNPIQSAYILKKNPSVVEAIKEMATALDKVYHLNYSDANTKIDDMIKLYDSIQEFESKYNTYVNNPNKQSEDKAKAKEKAAKINKESENIKKKDSIINKSVSEINEAIDEGELSEEDLLGMFPDGLPNEEEMSEVESKAKSALDIRDKTSKIKAEIDKSNADATTKNNAKKLIDNSKSLSDSLDDLTDLSSEAFNDPSFMYDELDPSLQGLDREALQDEVEIRLGGAKNLLSEMISIVEDNEGKLDNIPDFIPNETKESSIESTGHDSVDKNEPINKPKAVKTIKGTLADNLIQQAIDESNDSPIVMTLRDVIKDVDRLVNAGAVEKTIKKTIYNSASYNKAVEGFPGLVQAIDNYISNKLQERDSKAPEVKEEKGSDYNPSMEDDIPTVNILISDVQEHADNTYKSLDKAEGTGGIYTSWLSPLSKYYRYSPKGDMTTFDQVAEGMNYTPEKLKRVKAIWNYLNNHDVFEYISSGNVKVGDKIGFAISQTLNDEAGELVVIMLQDNHIVGVLPSENDKEFANYAGLSDFMELLKREYQEAGTPSNFISKYHTSVNKIMVGRVPYTSNDKTTILNNIFTETTSGGGTKEIPIELGISSGDGRNAEMIISSVRKGTSRSIKDKQRTIMSPLNAKKGQPYLLVRTSDPNRAYVSVPFSMPYYSQDTSDSALGIAIDNVLNSLVGLQAKDVMKVKREIQELLAIPELHINILKNGNLKIDAKFQGDDKQTNIYNGRQDNPNLVQEVKSKLYGTPFQVSRKYINDTYKGQDYNRMIGELAYTNIDGTHTIDDWFTINPIDKEGNEFKGKTFKTTRNNPNNAKPQLFEYNWKGIPLKVDLNTFEVRDSEGKVRTGKNVDKVQALAYGFKMNKTGVYKSPWGWFDSEKLEFVDEPKKEEVVKRTFALESSEEDTLQVEEGKEKPKTGQPTFNTPEQLEDQAKKKGLLGTPKRKELWKALNISQQEAILSAKGLRLKQLMDGLDRAFNISSKKFDLSKLGGSIERYLGVKPMFRRITESKEQMTQREIKWLGKVLPKLTSENKIELVKGLIKISEEDGGGFAWGQFKQGVITLSNLAARGTVYHEAFHAVTHTILNDSEYNELFKAGREKYGNLSEVAIEEKLAEDFRRYMQLEEIPFVGRVVKIFRNLKHIIQNLLGKEPYLNKLYYSINNGIYSNRKPKDSNIIRNKEYIPYQILEQELDKFKYDYALVTANRQLFEKEFSSTYLSDVKNYINNKDLSMVLYPYFRNGKYHVGIISRDKYNREVQSMTRDIQESMYYGQPLYRRVISDEVKNDCATFLANFGIKIEELQDYNSDVPLFDAINRVINVRSNEDITKGTAYEVAFMMQHNKTMNELIVLKAGAESNLKNLRRSLRVRGDYEARMSKDARRGLKVENYIDEISDDIANELNKFYNNQTIDSNSNIIKKIWDVITSFFELLTPGARVRFNVLHDYTRYIANAIILNDKSIILSSEHKPESNTELIEYKEGKEKAVLVNLEESLRENPYEESIIVNMNKEGISLAGGASLAAEKSLYRPAENPLHDLDFQASQYSREEIKDIIDKYYPNNIHTNYIEDLEHPNRYTDTYLIMDRPFRVEKSGIAKKMNIIDIETGEVIGAYMNSELVLNDGVQGKFLDFFMGSDNKPFPDKSMVINGKSYLISSSKNALRAKVEWHRPKDIWDYARYIPEEMRAVMDLEAMNREKSVREKLSNAKIIWGHPAIGKTTYLETHDDIVEWDELINPERNLFFREQIDPEHKLDMNSSEYKQLRSKYMSEWKEHPEYIEFLKEKWEWLKNKAKRENKRIFASPAPLLELFKDDFDLFVVLPEKEFMIRNQQRGGQYYASLGWKQIVNEKLINVDRSKILETSDYFSDFMKKYSLEGEARELEQHHREKYMLGNLSNEDKQFLIDKGISIEEYNRMSPFEREVLFHCR